MSIPVRPLDADAERLLGGETLGRLRRHFAERFQPTAGFDFLVKVPGRVNLIGEHVDYSGFAVLPMAIQKHILLAVGVRPLAEQPAAGGQPPEEPSASAEVNFARVTLSNVQDDRYERFSFTSADCLRESQPPRWHHYFVCGYKGVMDELGEQCADCADEANNNRSIRQLLSRATLEVAVLGDIPPSSGLSSSSALVCAAAIAVRHAVGLVCQAAVDRSPVDEPTAGSLAVHRGSKCRSELPAIDQLHMASQCARFERFIGTQGGGMDQAIALLAERGAARLIEFHPTLSSRSVRLPGDCEFFVAHCGQTLNKAATGHYNRRVLETRAAAVLLDRHLRADAEVCADPPVTLGEVMRSHGKSFDEMIRTVHQVLPAGRCLSLEQLLHELRAQSVEQLAKLVRLPAERLAGLFADAAAVSNELNGAKGTTNGSNHTNGGAKHASQATGDQVEVASKDSFDEVHREQGAHRLRLFERALHVYEEASRVHRLRELSECPRLPVAEKLAQVGQLMDESHESCRSLFDCSSEALDRLVQRSNEAGALGSRLTGAGWGGCIVAIVPAEKADAYLNQMDQHSRFVFRTSPGEGAVVYH